MLARRYLRRAVVDTGPLFSALTLEFLRSTSAPDETRKSVFGKNKLPDYLILDEARQENLLALFDNIQTLLIPPYVIGEIQGLQRLAGHSQRKLLGVNAQISRREEP
jgi:hypothetical protein